MRKRPHGDRMARWPVGARPALSFYRAGYAAGHRMAEVLAPGGLSPADTLVLRMLGNYPGESQVDIARRLGLSRQTVAYAAKRLAARGLVARVAGSRADHACYRLTVLGRREALKVVRRLRALERGLCQGGEEESARRLVGLLNRIAGDEGFAYADTL